MAHVLHTEASPSLKALKPDFLWIQKLLKSLELIQTEQKTGQFHPVSAACEDFKTPASWVSMLLVRIELAVLFLDGSAKLTA